MSIRKSSRVRTLSPKVRNSITNNSGVQSAINTDGVSQAKNVTNIQGLKRNLSDTDANALKKRKFVQDDKIDPVEKLLSLTTFNNDILNLEDHEQDSSNDEEEELDHSNNSSQHTNNSVCFTKILNENIRSYYSNFKKCPIEIHNDNSSFSILNNHSNASKSSLAPPLASPSTNQEVPFFRNVNFNPKPQSAYTFDEYLSLDEAEESKDDDEKEEPSSPNQSPLLSSGKMSFHYRHNDHLSLNGYNKQDVDPQDFLKYLNKTSILTGKASEMVSTGNFLINDFFL